MNAAANPRLCYGDRRLLVCRPGKDSCAEPCDRDAFPGDVLTARAQDMSLPPFTSIYLQEHIGADQWRNVADTQIYPNPGWAHKNADYCKTCGCVCFGGEALACGHNDYAKRSQRGAQQWLKGVA